MAAWCGRNLLSVLMHCCVIAALCSVLWLVAGHAIAFGDGGAANAWWGGSDKMFLAGSHWRWPAVCRKAPFSPSR